MDEAVESLFEEEEEYELKASSVHEAEEKPEGKNETDNLFDSDDSTANINDEKAPENEIHHKVNQEDQPGLQYSLKRPDFSHKPGEKVSFNVFLVQQYYVRFPTVIKIATEEFNADSYQPVQVGVKEDPKKLMSSVRQTIRWRKDSLGQATFMTLLIIGRWNQIHEL